MTDLSFDPELVEKSLRVLAEQGGPDEIAAFLQERGIKGTQSAMSCPVSNYIKSEALVNMVSTSCLRVIVAAELDAPSKGFDPPAVRCFVSNFDADRYPDLIANSP